MTLKDSFDLQKKDTDIYFILLDIMRRIFYMPECEDHDRWRGALISGGVRVGQGGDHWHFRVEHWKQPATLAAAASAPIQAKSPCGPCLSCSVDPQEGRGGNSWGEWPISDKGSLHTKLHPKWENSCECLNRQCTAHSLDNFSVANTSREPTRAPPFCFSTSLTPGQGSQWGEKKHTHQGNRASLRSTPGLATIAWERIPHLTEATEQRESPSSKTWLPPSPVHTLYQSG